MKFLQAMEKRQADKSVKVMKKTNGIKKRFIEIEKEQLKIQVTFEIMQKQVQEYTSKKLDLFQGLIEQST